MAVMARVSVRERLRRLVEELPDSEFKVAERYLEYLRNTSVDPVAHAIATAPYDDEGVTPEEEVAVERALEDIEAGRVSSHEEAARRLGYGD
ncbi:MAG: hypothetical protein ACUVWR_17900 [Anaerolineae bacterium]